MKCRKKRKTKKEKLSSVNQMAKNITGLLQEAGVDAKFIAAEVVRIYTDNGYPVHSPVITEDSKLWDCTSIAKELGILSTNGNPHDKAVSAIIQKLDLFADEIIRTALLELTGTFALQNNNDNELEVIIETAEGKYKKDLVYLNDYTMYVVEDVSGANVDKYHYEINFLPEWGAKITHKN